MRLAGAGDELSLLAELDRRKGRTRRPHRGSAVTDERNVRQKLDELSAALLRATDLVQELFAHTTDQDTAVKKK